MNAEYVIKVKPKEPVVFRAPKAYKFKKGFECPEELHRMLILREA